jgi:hypothetical protein
MAPDDRDGPEGIEDPLRRLEERLARASDAAERLLAEAARSASGRVVAAADAFAQAAADAPERSGAADRAAEPSAADRAAERSAAKPPPAGWQPSADAGESAGPGRGEAELESLVGVVRALRDLIPPDLQRRLAEALRELLLAARALIDWYLERLEQRRTTPVRVQDIPIL